MGSTSSSYSEKIYDLAEFMHTRYEELSVEEGWESQASCKVPFAKLPEENQKVMIGVAGSVIEYIKQSLKPRIIV